MNGLFISFEGGEGSGKTTQINTLSRFLTDQGYKVITTREPGGTDEGETIRQLLVKKDQGNWSPKAELLLFYAARTMLVENVIKPALAEGKIVISDRFSDSTLAYQGYGHGLDPQIIYALDNAILGGLKPDMTFLLDIPAEQGIERSVRRLSGESMQSMRAEDRFEQMDLDFHKRLREGFLEIAKTDPTRIQIIDARQNINEISQHIQNLIMQALPSS